MIVFGVPRAGQPLRDVAKAANSDAIGVGAGNRTIWACPTSYARGCVNTMCRSMVVWHERAVWWGLGEELTWDFRYFQ